MQASIKLDVSDFEKNFNQAREMVSKGLGKVPKVNVEEFSGNLRKTLNTDMNEIVKSTNEKFKTVGTNVASAFTSVPSKIKNSFETVKANFSDLGTKITDSIKTVPQKFSDMGTKIVGSVKSIPQNFVNMAKNIRPTVDNMATNVVVKFAEMGVKAVDGLRNLPSKTAEIVKSIPEKFSGLVGSIKDKISGVPSAFAAKIGEIPSKIKSGLQTVKENISNGLKSAVDKGSEILKSLATKAGEVMNATAEKIKSGFETVTKVGTVAISAAATAVSGLAKSSLDSYSSYEQLVGGVETLFKDSSDKVREYADNAYKTAGMSANQYMDTVTSFSATLLQGLGGDTSKAADYADKAIRDMSDNSNKMGTSIDMIQNAYQGFAKQNYAMLDNLKLGYGGTQSEMARLINESGVLGDSIEVNAETVKDVPFDKIIEAIHTVQENLGITGTTSKEASNTIEGSVNSMKAAWTNFTVELAKDNGNVDSLLDYLVESVDTAGQNIIPRIQKILEGIGQAVTKIAPVISKKLPALVKSVLPSILKASVSLVSSLGKGLVSSAPAILDSIIEVMEQVASLFESDNNGKKSGENIAVSLINSITERIPRLVGAGSKIIRGIADMIIQSAPEIMQAGANLAKTLVESIFENLNSSDGESEGIFSKLFEGTDFGEIDFGKIGQSLQELLGAVSPSISTLQEIGSQAVETIGKLASSGEELFEKIDFDKIGQSLQKVYDSISPIITEIGGAITWLSENVISPVVEWAANSVLPSVFDGLSASLDILKGSLDFLKTPAKAVWEEFLKPLASWTGDVVSVGLKTISDTLTTVADTFDGVDWEGYWLDFDNFGSNWKEGAGQIGEALSNAASDIDEFFNVSDIGEGWNDFWQGVGEAVFGLKEKFTEFTENWGLGMDSIVQGISNFKSNWEEGKQIIGDKIADLKEGWTTFKDNWGSGVDSIVKGVTTFKDNWQEGKKTIQENVEGLKGKWTEFKDNWGDGIDEMVEGIGGFIEGAKTWGTDLIENFMAGAKEKWDEWNSSWEDFGGAIYDILHHSTPEKGPLKDDDKWGGDFVDNFINGVKSKKTALTDEITSLSDGISESFSPESGFTANIHGIFENLEVPELSAIINGIVRTPELANTFYNSGAGAGFYQNPQSNITVPNININFSGSPEHMTENDLRTLARRISGYINQQLGVIDRREIRAVGGAW